MANLTQKISEIQCVSKRLPQGTNTPVIKENTRNKRKANISKIIKKISIKHEGIEGKHSEKNIKKIANEIIRCNHNNLIIILLPPFRWAVWFPYT